MPGIVSLGGTLSSQSGLGVFENCQPPHHRRTGQPRRPHEPLHGLLDCDHSLDQMVTYDTCRTGDQNLHGLCLVIPGSRE